MYLYIVGIILLCCCIPLCVYLCWYCNRKREKELEARGDNGDNKRETYVIPPGSYPKQQGVVYPSQNVPTYQTPTLQVPTPQLPTQKVPTPQVVTTAYPTQSK